MLKLVFITAAMLVVSAYASSRCCGPSQYMGALGTIVGQSAMSGKDPLGVNILQSGAWDYVNRRFGNMMTLVYANGTSYQFRIIQDYQKGVQFVVIDEYKYCEEQTAPQPEPQNCIPDDAVSYGSLYFGGNGSDAILADVWSKTFTTGTLVGSGSITVRKKDCFPLGSQFMGTSSEMGPVVPTIASSGWFNITIGIPKPDDWFTVPSYCNQQEINATKQKPRHHSIPDISLKLFF